MLSVVESRPALFPHSAVQKRNNLPTGTDSGGNVTVTRAAGDSLLCRYLCLHVHLTYGGRNYMDVFSLFKKVLLGINSIVLTKAAFFIP